MEVAGELPSDDSSGTGGVKQPATSSSRSWSASSRAARTGGPSFAGSILRRSIQSNRPLAAAYDPDVGSVPFCLQDHRLPFPGPVLEAVGVEQRPVELAALELGEACNT
jgi:hypothetical protein